MSARQNRQAEQAAGEGSLRWTPVATATVRPVQTKVALLLGLLVAGWVLVDQTIARPVAAWAYQDDGASAGAAKGAEGAAPAGGTDPIEWRKNESFLMWMLRASGIFGFLIFLVSFIMVALIMMDILQLRRVNYLPADFVEQFEQKLNSKDYQGAYDLAKNDESFIGRVLAAGMARLPRGYDDMVQGMQEVADDETMAMEHKLSYLGLIASVAPMLGLLGTVQGMVLSFQVIATSTTQPKPYELADGIATALFTTLEGLIVAIPAIIAFSIFKNRLARFVFEAAIVSENLMSRFQGLGRAPAPAARPAAPAAQG